MRINVIAEIIPNRPSMIVLVLFFMFLVGSMLGYLMEVLFRRFFSAKRWVNPGFMKGPWLPLYGFGLVLMFIIQLVVMNLLPSDVLVYNPSGAVLFPQAQNGGPTVYDLVPICISWVALNVLEFVAGLIFVKGFKVRLWNYDNMKGNIMGIVCPVFSVIWLVASVIYYYALSPATVMIFDSMYGYMFGTGSTSAHFGFIFIMGIAYGIMIVDLVSSLGLFHTVSKIAKKGKELINYDEIIAQGRGAIKNLKKKFGDMIPEDMRKNMAESSQKNKENAKKLNRFVRSIFLKDPDKTKTTDYGEDNRPKKEE